MKGEGAQPLLVFSDGVRSMALVVDEIVDIVEDRLEIQVSGDQSGVLGSAIVKGRPPRSSTSASSCRSPSRTGSATKDQARRRAAAIAAADRRHPVLPQYARRRCCRPPATRCYRVDRAERPCRCSEAGRAFDAVVTISKCPR